MRVRRAMHPIFTVGARDRNNIHEVGQRVGHERWLYDIHVHVDVFDPLERRRPIRLGLGMTKAPAVEIVNGALDGLSFDIVRGRIETKRA